jgi:transposase
MGKPYSDDLRELVVAAIEAGQTHAQVAKLYNMALSTVGGFIKRMRETGRVSPDKFGGYKTFALEPHTTLVKELVSEQPDSTLAELQVRLAKEEVKVAVWHLIDEPFALRSPAIEAGHVGGGGSLIDEDKFLRIKG